MKRVLDIEQANYHDTIKNGIVFIDFWAPWCAPCRAMLPIIDELALEFKDIKVCKVNIDENQNLTEALKVRSVPTFFIYKDGELKRELQGARTKRELFDELRIFNES